MERDREILRYAYTQSPFYQSLLDKKELSVENLMEDWTEIPVVDKRQLVCADESVLPFSSCDSLEDSQMIFQFSAGCTGLCMEIMWSLKDMISSMSPLWEYRKKFYGLEPQDKSCHFYMYPDYCDELPQEEDFRADLGFSMLDLNRDRVKAIYQVMCDYQPKWLLMQPSIAILFADYISQSGAEPIQSLECVELTGEWVSKKQKKAIENAFQCKTVNIYGSYEMNAIAYECPEGHLHLLEDNVRVEIMKGDKVLPDGEEGDIVLTSACNTIMPFVRYKIGDRGRICPEKCACGHPGKILELTRTRKNDMIQVEDDINIVPYEFTYAIQCVIEITGIQILQYQVEQTSYFSYIVSIVVKDKGILEDENLQEDIIHVFKENIVHEYLKNGVYTFRFRDELLSRKSTDKLRTFWSFKGDEND